MAYKYLWRSGHWKDWLLSHTALHLVVHNSVIFLKVFVDSPAKSQGPITVYNN